MMFTLSEILEATGGVLLAGTRDQAIAGVSTDTRSIRRGELFVAVQGENFDGHGFIAEAVKKGAAALVISARKAALPDGVAVILVDNTVKAFGHIAGFHRRRFNIPVIAVTGSAGKTSTKELIAAVLSKKYRVLFNKGTENNHMGVPMTLLKLAPQHQAAVIEMGTNHPGEIAWLAGIASPTVAVFTNVGASHLEGLGTPLGVYAEKRTLLTYLARDGHVVINADDPYWSRLLRKRLPQKIVSCAIDAPADIKVQAITVKPDGFHVRVKGRPSFVVRNFSRGAVLNALAAIACGSILGVGSARVSAAISQARPALGRQCLIKAGGVIVIDDTYNANPVSYRNALATLNMLECRGRVVLVAADMLELGGRSMRLHRQIGREIADGYVDVLLTSGQHARRMGEAARARRPSMDVRHLDDQAMIVDALKNILRSGDLLLCKGSRGMRMEKVVGDIVAHLKG